MPFIFLTPFTDQIGTDLKQFLTDWQAAQLNLRAGINGASMSDQFVSGLANAGIAAVIDGPIVPATANLGTFIETLGRGLIGANL